MSLIPQEETFGRPSPPDVDPEIDRDDVGFVPKDDDASVGVQRSAVRRFLPWLLACGALLLLLPLTYLAGRASAPRNAIGRRRSSHHTPTPTFPPMPNVDAGASWAPRTPTPAPPALPAPIPAPSVGPALPGVQPTPLSQEDRERISRGLDVVRKARASLLNYYENDTKILNANLRPASSDDVLAARMAKAILAPAGERKWVVAFVGSSVTAGHDTFESASYSEVLGRRMRPLWEALEVNLTVRNQGVGGRGPNPWFVCMRQMVGDDADIVNREWEYWPFDEQFIEGKGLFDFMPLAKPGADTMVAGAEAFMRYTLELRHQPAIHFLNLNHHGRTDVSWLNSYVTASGPLAAYRTFSMNSFDHFGTPFDHFKSRSEKRKNKDGSQDCQGRNVADCPVDVQKQDGHHTRPEWRGFDPQKHPDWLQEYNTNANRFLFTNWHPAPLGHEVIGNQLASYHMAVLEKALETLLAPDFSNEALATKAAVLPLPSPRACSDAACNPQFQARCATAVQPAAQGPHIGDWLINGTNGTKWKDQLVMGQPDAGALCNKAKQPGISAKESYTAAKGCSYRDAKHAFAGGMNSGRLTIGFSDLYQCQIYIADSQFSWTKPVTVAKWESDVVIRLNGEICKAPVCRIVHDAGGHMTGLWVDARAEMGSACRRELVQVSFEVVPAPAVDHRCVLTGSNCKTDASHKNFSAAFASNFKGLCNNPPNCSPKPRYNDPSQLRAYVGVALAF